MTVIQTAIEGLVIIEPKVFGDAEVISLKASPKENSKKK